MPCIKESPTGKSIFQAPGHSQQLGASETLAYMRMYFPTESFAAGTANENVTALPANRWRDLTEMTLELIRDSLRTVHFSFLPSGRMKACFKESDIKPKYRIL